MTSPPPIIQVQSSDAAMTPTSLLVCAIICQISLFILTFKPFHHHFSPISFTFLSALPTNTLDISLFYVISVTLSPHTDLLLKSVCYYILKMHELVLFHKEKLLRGETIHIEVEILLFITASFPSNCRHHRVTSKGHQISL